MADPKAYPHPFTHSPSISHLSIPPSAFISANPKYGVAGIGSLVFYPSNPASSTNPSKSPSQPDRLLLIQRSRQERAFALCWEFPGGGCEADSIDTTLLHACARELYEEAGLRTKHVVRQVGKVQEFGGRSESWGKINLEVGVEGVRGDGGEIMGEEEVRGEMVGANVGDDGLEDGDGRIVRVKLSPEEHERYMWATEDEIRSQEIRGEKIQFPSHDVWAIALEGFRLRREQRASDGDVLKSQADA